MQRVNNWHVGGCDYKDKVNVIVGHCFLILSIGMAFVATTSFWIGLIVDPQEKFSLRLSHPYSVSTMLFPFMDS